jgi:hypothetical protein
MQRTTVFLTAKETAGLKKLAKGTGARPAELIRRAIDVYLEPRLVLAKYLLVRRRAKDSLKAAYLKRDGKGK